MFSISSLLIAFATTSANAQVYVDPPDDMLDQGVATVFVSPFQPVNREAAGLAGMMSAFLEAELDQRPDVSSVPIDAVPPVHEMSASLYIESCPPGQHVGCAFVVGEVAAADFALTGTVESTTDGTRVEIVIIDVLASREAMSFVAVLGVGEDERFAEGVASVLTAVVRGEAGRVEDIRDLSVSVAPDYSGAAAQLAQLTSELGDVEAMVSRSGTLIEAPKVTVEEISERMDREGVKPWERVGLGPDEYLRWRNSGEDLETWRARHDGRKGRLLLRAGFGFFRGPSDGVYRGVAAMENRELQVVEGYSWQTMASGSGLLSEFSVGYGITPEIEVGGLVGLASGQYQTRVETIVFDAVTGRVQDSGEAGVLTYTNSNHYLGAYGQYVFRPAMSFRPLVGLGALYWVGDTVDGKEEVSESLGTFDAPHLWMVQVKGGAELKLSDHLDLFVHIPVTINIAGASSDVFNKGEALNPESGQPYIDTASDRPPDPSPVGGGMLVGVQFNGLGRKHK